MAWCCGNLFKGEDVDGDFTAEVDLVDAHNAELEESR